MKKSIAFALVLLASIGLSAQGPLILSGKVDFDTSLKQITEKVASGNAASIDRDRTYLLTGMIDKLNEVLDAEGNAVAYEVLLFDGEWVDSSKINIFKASVLFPAEGFSDALSDPEALKHAKILVAARFKGVVKSEGSATPIPQFDGIGFRQIP